MAESPKPEALVLLHPASCRSPEAVRRAQDGAGGRLAVFERRRGMRSRAVLVERPGRVG